MKNRLSKIALLLAGTLVGLVLGEVVVAVSWPQVFELQPKGMYTADPETGYALTPGFRGTLERSEFRVAITTGREGLRGGDLRPRRPESFRVLILGDSQVWGFGVEEHETISHRLEHLLSRRYSGLDVQVINGGVPGYGTADELNFLRSRGRSLDPDLVLLLFFPVNDFDENRAPAKTWADIRAGVLVRRSGLEETPDQPAYLRLKWWLKAHSHLVRLVSDTLGYVALRGGLLRWAGSLWQTGEGFSDEDAENAVQLLERIAGTAEELGARTLFVYTTGQDRVLSDGCESPRSVAVVEAAARGAGMPWIDVTPGLCSRPDRMELFFPRDGHWTASGHRAVAEVLYSEIVSSDLVELAEVRR